MATKRTKPIFVILADGHKVGDRGKIDCYGIFTSMGVWALPAARECSIAFSIRNVPKGNSTLSFWFRKSGQKAKRITNAKMHSTEAVQAGNYAHRIKLDITETGNLEFGLSVGRRLTGHNAFWTPLLVHTLPWPELPVGDDLHAILDDPHSIKSVRANLTCDKCQSEFTFQKDLDPSAELDKKSLPFPKNGVFRCTTCRKRHDLKDIEGQVLTQLGKISKEQG